MFDEAAEAQFADGGPPSGLLVGEVAGGQAQEPAVVGQCLQQVGAFAAGLAGGRGRVGGGVGRVQRLRLSSVVLRV
ncbi:hypothetical protein [Streptomyces sp. NPDC052701]|uniref:hypothetical protein n=1 Tax=Streptomyces sp. NPDC052701 TaxID=3155533 RepID=UPI0034334F5D